jgi:hypothetical protein
LKKVIELGLQKVRIHHPLALLILGLVSFLVFREKTEDSCSGEHPEPENNSKERTDIRTGEVNNQKQIDYDSLLNECFVDSHFL